MGCLNDSDRWTHWFSNIHLSGPCNRRCYFCIGQHMMALDSFNSLDTPPNEMRGFRDFLRQVREREILEVDLTGTNTDPCLYRHHDELVRVLRSELPGVSIGIRTNGTAHAKNIGLYDKGSITVCSADYHINQQMMGGPPPDLGELTLYADLRKFKINCVLGPQNSYYWSVLALAELAERYGIQKINLREPYGQAHIGHEFMEAVAGMPEGAILQGTVPFWRVGNVEVFYWDVHVVGVRSVNLYANGRISLDYPVTRGHTQGGIVVPQDQFEGHQRRERQWVKS